VELAGPGACIVDLRRVGKTVCWQQLADRQIERLQAHGLRAWIGIAPTPDLAQLAACGARPAAIVYDIRAFADSLPVEALEPSESVLQILRGWGIHRVEEFLALPKSGTIERLGPEAESLWRRVSGRNKRPLRLVHAAPEYAEAFDFDHEVETAEPILFLLRRFLEGLCARLQAVYRVAQSLTLRLPLEDGSSHQRVFCIPAPTAKLEVLFRILHTHLEDLQLTARPVGIRLSLQAVPPAGNQLQLFESSLRDPNQFGETLAKLKAFLGNDRVGVPARSNTYRPDSYLLADGFPGERETQQKTAGPQKPPRGLLLRRYRPAIGSVVRLENDRPVSIESTVTCGVICECAGPYRLSGDWWDRENWQQEEWDVALAQGGLYRLARHGIIWKIEGCYEN
jgi:protein ImuB